MSAYYNEIDPLKAEIIRQAIKDGAIAPGDVDDRSIADVEPADLVGYTQAHFFAGGGFWSLALRQAGWPDDRAVWTGSCPCPSFSAAGKGQGFSDPRHLWPHWARLIRELHPPTIFGEQVSAAIGHGWLDLVQTDLEMEDYAVGKIVLGACSVGAPHIRQRLYFVANAQHAQWRPEHGEHGDAHWRHGLGWSGDAGIMEHAEGGGLGMRRSAPGNGGHAAQPSELGGVGDSAIDRNRSQHGEPRSSGGQEEPFGRPSISVSVGDASRTGLERHGGDGRDRNQPGRFETIEAGPVATASEFSWLADTNGGKSGDGELQRSGKQRQQPQDGGVSSVANATGGQLSFAQRRPDQRDGIGPDGADDTRVPGRPGPLNGFWRDADWIGCRDGKFRPVEPKYVWMADGRTAPMGFVCDAGGSNFEIEEEKVNATEVQTRPDQHLPLLRQTSSSQALDERGVGGSDELYPPALLRPKVHGVGLQRNDQGAKCQEQPEAIGQGGKEGLRTVWEDEVQVARSPQRRKSDEQRAREFAEFVRLLPSSFALAEVRGDTATVEALRLLLKTSGAERLVLHPSIPVETLWRSLTEEVQDRLWMDFEAGGFRRTIEFPLATGATARVGRLRLYGDAICVPAAQAFIESYLEADCNKG